MLRSSWEVVLVTPTAAVIRDLDIGMSVTNDAEAVVAALLRAGTIRPGMRLHYYDTDGRLDELEFTEKGFDGFCSDPPDKDTAEALAKIGH